MTIDRTTLLPGDACYPTGAFSDSSAPPTIECIGNTALLGEPAIALFCSRQCPGALVNATYDLAQRLRDAGKTVIGGFHSPMEQECLRLLLRGGQPVIICPARAIQDYRLSSEWQAGLRAHGIDARLVFDGAGLDAVGRVPQLRAIALRAAFVDADAVVDQGELPARRGRPGRRPVRAPASRTPR